MEKFRIVRCPNLSCRYFMPADDRPLSCPDCGGDMSLVRAIPLVALADVKQAVREGSLA